MIKKRSFWAGLFLVGLLVPAALVGRGKMVWAFGDTSCVRGCTNYPGSDCDYSGSDCRSFINTGFFQIQVWQEGNNIVGSVGPSISSNHSGGYVKVEYAPQNCDYYSSSRYVNYQCSSSSTETGVCAAGGESAYLNCTNGPFQSSIGNLPGGWEIEKVERWVNGAYAETMCWGASCSTVANIGTCGQVTTVIKYILRRTQSGGGGGIIPPPPPPPPPTPPPPYSGGNSGSCNNISARANINGSWTEGDIYVYYGDTVGASFGNTGSGTVFFQNWRGWTGRQCSSSPGAGSGCPVWVTIDPWWGSPGQNASIHAFENTGTWWEQRGNCEDNLRVNILGNRPAPPPPPPPTNRSPYVPVLLEPPDGVWLTSQTNTFSATVTDPDGNNVKACFAVNGANQGCGPLVSHGSNSSLSINFGSDAAGVPWLAFAQDSQGANSGNSSSRTLRIDTTPPGAVLCYPVVNGSCSPATALVNTNIVSLQLTSTDATSGLKPNSGVLEYRLGNSSTWNVVAGVTATAGLVNFTGSYGQTYFFRFKVSDNVNLISPYSAPGNGLTLAEPVGTVSGPVFLDLNADGLRDGGETLLSGAAVTLRKSDGTVVATLTSLSTANWTINNVVAGTDLYRLEITPPAGYTAINAKWKQGLEVSENYLGSAAPFSTSSTTATYPIDVAGGAVTTVNLGLVAGAGGAISGVIFLDANRNGVKDVGESSNLTTSSPLNSVINSVGLSGLLSLSERVVGSVSSSIITFDPATGVYRFSNLNNGDYQLRLTLPNRIYATKWSDGLATFDYGGSGLNRTVSRTGVDFPVLVRSEQTINFGLEEGGTLNGFVFKDDNDDGLKSGEVGGLAGVLSLAAGDGSQSYSVSPAADGSFSLALPAGSYRLELTPNYSWNPTKWNDGSTVFAYGQSGLFSFTKTPGSDYPLPIAPAGSTAADLGLKPVPVGGLTLELYSDPGLDGIGPGDPLLTGTVVEFDCSPSLSGSACQPDLATNPSTGRVVLNGLVQGETYTVTYDKKDSGYEMVTDIVNPDGLDCTGGAAIPKPPTCSFTLGSSLATVKFGVTNNSLPWVQVWDGDVYSNSGDASREGIKITTNVNATNPPYHPVFIQTSGNGGGLALARAETLDPGINCNSLRCSERDWLISDYGLPISWPAGLDLVNSDGVGVCYYPSNLTIDGANAADFRGLGGCARKITIVNGDLEIKADEVAGGGSLNGFLVARGKITISGAAAANELIINGGLYAKDYFVFTYALFDNRKPLLVVKYDPALLTIPSGISEPTYTWREVSL